MRKITIGQRSTKDAAGNKVDANPQSFNCYTVDASEISGVLADVKHPLNAHYSKVVERGETVTLSVLLNAGYTGLDTVEGLTKALTEQAAKAGEKGEALAKRRAALDAFERDLVSAGNAADKAKAITQLIASPVAIINLLESKAEKLAVRVQAFADSNPNHAGALVRIIEQLADRATNEEDLVADMA